MAGEDTLNSALKNEVLNWPELGDLIDQRAEQKFKRMCLDQRLTRDQMAKLYQVHRDTIDNLNSGELQKLGWEKIYIGSLPRFQRIAIVDASRELFRKIKKGK